MEGVVSILTRIDTLRRTVRAVVERPLNDRGIGETIFLVLPDPSMPNPSLDASTRDEQMSDEFG